jgi:hypothetical protein
MMAGGTKILNPQEQAQWGKKLNKGVDAKPLSFEKAQEANAPFQISVTNGQVPEGKTLIIQLLKRPDIHPDRAVQIVQHALVDVFGRHAGAEAECDYRNVAELRKRFGNEMVSEDHDSLTVIFSPGTVAYTRRPHWVRDQMAAACRRWYDASRDW